MNQTADLSGSTLRERYRVQKLLSRSMGAVYAALDLTDDRPVVIKTADSTEEMARLVSERETLIRLSHPGIVRCLDFWSDPERVVLVLERLEGRSLLEELDETPGLPDERALVQWGIDLARILEYLHGQTPPVIHRDLKPQHAFLGSDGRVRLLDFGIARLRRGESRDTEHLGTPGYAAPEQYGHLGRESDERTDVYGLGATLFHLATGRSLEPGIVPMAREYRPGLSPRLARVIDRAVSRDPEARYPSVRSMLEDLEACRFSAAVPEWKAWAVGSSVTGLAAWWGSSLMAAGSGVEGPLTALLLAAAALGALLAYRSRDPLPRTAGITLLASGVLTLLACLNPEMPAGLGAWFRRLGLEAAPLLLRVPALGWVFLALWIGWMTRLGLLWRRGGRGAPQALLVVFGLLLAASVWLHGEALARDTLPVLAQSNPSRAHWEVSSQAMSRLQPVVGRGGEVDLRCGFLVTDDLSVQVFRLRSGEVLWSRSVTHPVNLMMSPGQFIFLDGLTLEGVDVETGEPRNRVVLEEPCRYVLPVNSDTMVAASTSGTHWQAFEWPTGRLKWSRPAEGLLRSAWEEHGLADQGMGRLSLVDLETGRDVWSLDAGPGPGTYRVVPGEDLLLWFGNGGIRAFSRADGSEVYRIPDLLPDSSAAVDIPRVRSLPQRVVVGAGSRVAAFDPRSGRVKWSVDLGLERVGEVFTGLGTVPVQCLSGRLLGLSAADGSLVWEHWPRDPSGEPVDPVGLGQRTLKIFPFDDRAIYQVPGGSEARVLDFRTGAVLARIDLGAGQELRAATAVPGRLLVALARRDGVGTVRSLPLPVRHDGGAEGSALRIY